MAKRIAEVQDKVEEMRRARFEVEEDVRRRRLEPLDPKLVLEYVRDLKEFLESSNIFERRAFLGSFIESIEADDGEITFNYTLPLPPDNSRQETNRRSRTGWPGRVFSMTFPWFPQKGSMRQSALGKP